MSVVGFDVGNDTCTVAVARQRGIDVILNDESKRETPAVVSFMEKQRYVGAASSTNPRNSVSQRKRLLGRKFTDPQLQADLLTLPFKVTEGADGFPLVHVNYLGEERRFTPTQLFAMVLSNVKGLAEKNMKTAVVDCCIGILCEIQLKLEDKIAQCEMDIQIIRDEEQMMSEAEKVVERWENAISSGQLDASAGCPNPNKKKKFKLRSSCQILDDNCRDNKLALPRYNVHPISNVNFDMSCNQLTGPIPPILGNLTYTEKLYLQGNKLTGPIPPELGNMSRLHYLELNENQLTGYIPPELGKLTDLLVDLVGFGVAAATGTQYLWSYPERCYNSSLIPSMLQDKRIGEASGKGFYIYDDKRKASIDPEIAKYVEKSRRLSGF